MAMRSVDLSEVCEISNQTILDALQRDPVARTVLKGQHPDVTLMRTNRDGKLAEFTVTDETSGSAGIHGWVVVDAKHAAVDYMQFEFRLDFQIVF